MGKEILPDELINGTDFGKKLGAKASIKNRQKELAVQYYGGGFLKQVLSPEEYAEIGKIKANLTLGKKGYIVSSEAARYAYSRLRNHENNGGHTLGKHVSKELSYLQQRVNTGTNPATSFWDASTANNIHNQIHVLHRNYIRYWISSNLPSTQWFHKERVYEESTPYDSQGYYVRLNSLGKASTSYDVPKSGRATMKIKKDCCKRGFGSEGDDYVLVTVFPD